MKTLCLISTFLLTAALAHAQGPNNSGTYYRGANGKKGQALKTAFHNIIKDPDVATYAGLIEVYKKTDTRPDGYVRDWYSNITNFTHVTDKAGTYTKEGDVYNREHSVPASWFANAAPMYSDAMHVIPADGYVNNRRSNYPLGEVGTISWQSANGYSKLGTCRTPGYSSRVFEPNDEVKGDLARIYFYMVTCYEDRCTGWGHSVFSPDGYPGLEQWALDMFMRWSRLDPVDDVERARNNAVFGVQENRNPFVDYPGLENYVWGSLKDTAFSYDNYGGDVIDNPDEPTPDEPTPDTPAESCTIALNSSFFGVSWTGVRPSGAATELTGTTSGVTVVYAMGSGGSNMYANSSQIRLYQKNTLTFSVNEGNLTSLKFTLATASGKQMQASCGTVDGYVWTGKAPKVVISVSDGSGNMQLKSVDVTVTGQPTAIATLADAPQRPVCHDLQGRRVGQPRKGLYVSNGKKIIIK